ncbi:MAG: hypothetical protein AABX38_06715 [Candidatus Micrarchaeota archaeon]
MSINKYFIYLVVLIVAILAVFFIFNKPQTIDNSNFNLKPPYPLPTTPTHWHADLKIFVNGQERYIPENIGVNIGNVIDTSLGMETGISPIHTHSAADEYGSNGRRLHVENLNPSKKPETLTLGYFFKVWGKTFNSTCILDVCNNNGKTVKMAVNGQPNTEFNNYFLRDGDQIIIRYE